MLLRFVLFHSAAIPYCLSLSPQAAEAVQMKETFPDRVIYILSVPRATSQDSGTYECSITHVMSGTVRASRVAVTVFGEKHFYLSWSDRPTLHLFLTMSSSPQ